MSSLPQLPQKLAISPLIRLTLLLFYITLIIPLPFLATATAAPISSNLLWLGSGIGLVLIYAALSEQVILDEEKIQVIYPRWNSWLFRRQWQLAWSEIKDLKMRTTGQGGLVYYFTNKSSNQAYLLPMRVAGFTKLVAIVQAKTGIDTTDIRPLSQPWMYLILLGCSLLLLLVDGSAIATALALQ
jgi:hypothetical protein